MKKKKNYKRPEKNPETIIQKEPEEFKLDIKEEAFEDFGELTIDNKKPKKIDRKKREKQRKVFSVIGFLVRLVVIVAFFVGVAYVSVGVINAAGDIFGLNEKGNTYQFQVSQTDTIESVADELGEKGIIKYPTVFKLFSKYQNENMAFVEGDEYKLHGGMSYQEIIAILCQSNQVLTATVTIPEGTTVPQIAQLLADNEVCDYDEFIDEVNNGEFDFDFIHELNAVEGVEDRPFRLEGYLFPDTYEFYIDENPTQVVKKFLVNFNAKYDDELMAKIEKKGYTLDEAIKISSIIQKEASRFADMRNVASVYLNRLRNTQTFSRLQADPTTHYAQKYLEPAGVSQEIQDAYDTYVSKGLPLGPITNSGLLAIKAMLDPMSTNYYYFVTSEDGKDFYYANTYEQHKINCKKAGIEEGRY